MTDNLPTTDLARAFALRIARESPTLADLSEAQLDRLARAVVAERLKDDLKRRAGLAGVDFPAERKRYLARCGSPHTRRAYRSAIGLLDAWCERQGVEALDLTPALADDWIESLKAEGRAPGSVRLAVAAASAFWTWLERRHAELRNPFRGSRARPANKARRALAVPSPAEVEGILAAADPTLGAAIAVMYGAGLRVGGLPGLRVNGERFTTESKGKEHSGKLPAEAREALEQAGLPLRSPFADLTAAILADRFRYLVGKLHKAGELRAAYSVHDLRHAFAARLYEASGHDLYRVKEALGHASVSVTEHYLRSLDAEV